MKRRILESESSQRWPRKALGFVAAFSIGVALLSGCGTSDEGANAEGDKTAPAAHHGSGTSSTPAAAATDTPQSAEALGSVGFDLQLGGVKVDSGTYRIHSSKFDTTGPINLTNATTFSVLVGGVPFDTGYEATLSAMQAADAGPRLTCTGSATFDVASAGTTTVPVKMLCKEAAPAVPVPRGALAMLGLLFAASGMIVLRGSGRSLLRRA
jgi:hypothetical protein